MLIRDLCKIEHGLTGWERGFIDDVAEKVLDRGFKLTSNQVKKAEEILNRVEGNDFDNDGSPFD